MVSALGPAGLAGAGGQAVGGLITHSHLWKHLAEPDGLEVGNAGYTWFLFMLSFSFSVPGSTLERAGQTVGFTFREFHVK